MKDRRHYRARAACRAFCVMGSLLGLLLSACTEREAPPPKHLILITVDTLRADHLGFYGYDRDTSPNLDRLAAEGTVFERAIAQWPKTGPSFASMFIGQYPHTTGLTHKAAQRLPEELLTLPELMQLSGFTTLAVNSNGVLAKHLGWDGGFDEYLQTWDLAPETSDDPQEYRRWINARRVNELALPMLERHRKAEKLFVWLHYSDPHAPYVLPDDYPNPFIDDAFYVGDETVVLENPRATALGERRDLKHYVAAYDANIRLADEEIAKAIAELQESGVWQDALVVMTADHGESLGEHEYYFGHGRLPYNDGSHVPLLISTPGQRQSGESNRVAEAVELIDLYPTLHRILIPEMTAPGLEGRSLLPWLQGLNLPPIGDPQSEIETLSGMAYSNAGGGSPLTHFRSVQNERFKLIFHPAFEGRKRQRPERWELYDLAIDPAESNNLLGDLEANLASELDPQQASQLRQLRRQLLEWMNGRQWIRPPKAQIEAHNEDMMKTLRALGYIQ